jgi:signal transduction histidine kinase
MRKGVVCLSVAMAVIFGLALVSHAATLDDAKSLAEKAAAFVKANGKEKGIDEIGNPKGQFVKGDLYVTMQDTKGIVVANPVNPTIVGQNHMDLKDPSGKLFVKEMIQIATTKGGGWTTYTWVNPATRKVQAKKSWVQKVEGTDLYTLCGIFQ